MDSLYSSAWDILKKYCDQSEDISLNEEKRNIFLDDCKKLHKDFWEKRMLHDKIDKRLDRHKLAAIIAIVGSDEKFYTDYTTIVKENLLNIGRFVAPLAVALSFIEQEIKSDLKELNLDVNGIFELYIPKAVVCETPYIAVIGRLMYNEEKEKIDNTLRVLELSNILFLLEECALISSKINMDEWVKKKRKKNIG